MTTPSANVKIRRPGQYSPVSPAITTPRTPPAQPPQPEPTPVDEQMIEESMEDVAQVLQTESDEVDSEQSEQRQAPEEVETNATETAGATPIERWRKGLAAVKLAEADADKMVSSLLEKGYWEESFSLFKGKLTIRLRSRDAWALSRVTEVANSLRAINETILSSVTARVNLCCSLITYNRKSFTPVCNSKLTLEQRQKAYDEIDMFLDTIPGPVVLQMYTVLGTFDRRVYAALAEGAELAF